MHMWACTYGIDHWMPVKLMVVNLVKLHLTKFILFLFSWMIMRNNYYWWFYVKNQNIGETANNNTSWITATVQCSRILISEPLLAFGCSAWSSSM